jgi:hypothetical protein
MKILLPILYILSVVIFATCLSLMFLLQLLGWGFHKISCVILRKNPEVGSKQIWIRPEDNAEFYISKAYWDLKKGLMYTVESYHLSQGGQNFEYNELKEYFKSNGICYHSKAF